MIYLPEPPTIEECPQTAGMGGICQEQCRSNDDCAEENVCCSNGCGHVCIPRDVTAYPPTQPSGIME